MLYTPLESLDNAEEIDRERRESKPTPVWHLSKSCGVSEAVMLHHLGRVGIEVFRWGPDRDWHIDKADARLLMGLGGAA